MLFVSLYSYAAKKQAVPSKKAITSQAINATVDGKSFRGLRAYKISPKTIYFSVREVAKLYHVALEWKPVRSQVTMSLSNGKIDIKANSAEVVFGKKSKKMSFPSKLIKGDIYVSPEILTFEEFAEFAQADAIWNPATLTLNLKRKADTSSQRDSTQQTTLEELAQNDDLKQIGLAYPAKSGQAQISEVVSMIENNENNEDLKNSPITQFESEDIIDDSYKMVDDTATTTLIPQVSKKKHYKPKKIIVLDAGHGGKDSGVVGPKGTKEKDMNLDITLKLKSIFDKDDDYEIVLTRKDDTFIPLAQRPNIANEHNADLFISVHCNGNPSRNVSGFEIYFLSEHATDSEAAATANLENFALELEGKPNKKHSLLQNMLWSMVTTEHMNESAELSGFIAPEAASRLKIHNRGVKQANFCVLRGAQMPAVLVESAFLSNYSEEAKLCSKKFRLAVSNAIYQGVKKYYARKAKEQSDK
ncbi:MAG: N-acetylmuramoyl-L-alanine amidase [Endomicrobium sp.]|nr:N-acetylmuramoyl-L-alanine amidase [Endomicrobium sp.]